MSLGQLVWFSVHKASVKLELSRAKELFAALNLDPAYLPRGILPVYAFQAASAAIVETYIDDVTGEHVTLKVQQVSRSSEQHVRHVIRYATNKKTRLTSAGMVIELKFNHARRTEKGRQPVGHAVTDRIVNVLVEATSGDKPRRFHISDQDRQVAETWLMRFREEYESLQTHLSADAIRTVVRDLLLSCDALLANARGGTYFVPTEHRETVAALHAFVAGISDKCHLNAFDLEDTPTNISMLQDVWLENARDALERIDSELSALEKKAAARNSKLMPKQAVSLLVEWKALKEKLDHYAALTRYPSSSLRELTQPYKERIVALQQLTR